MNKISSLTKRLLILLFIISSSLVSNQLHAQCFTAIAAARDTIACGESLLLEQVGVGGLSSDDFTAGTLSGLWSAVSSGYVIGGPCGTSPIGGQHLWFGSGCPTPRFAETVPVDASCGGDICFDFRQETQGNPCDGPDLPGEGVYLEYQVAGGPWTQIFYFSPIGFPYTGWQNHCFPIPAAAQTPATKFRWIQTQTSGLTWDFWGIDNVSIATCAGFSTFWSGGAIPTPYTLDTITVSPVDSTTYTVLYTNVPAGGTDSCSASMTVYVEQPSIVASVLSSQCTGSDTLHAQATIAANCDYTLELWNYLPGSGANNAGWSAGTNPQTYHNLDIHLNGSLFSNYTMVQGSNFSSETYTLPVTDGDILESIFSSLGNAANECLYRIYDSQGVLLFTEGFPGSVPGSRTIGNGNAITVACPATASYIYSWINITSGGVAGLNDPNVQNPLATVAIPTLFEVTASDSLNSACEAVDTVSVTPNANTISATMSGPPSICFGDPVILTFNLVGFAPWNLDLDINGTNQSFVLDQFGMINGTGAPITFYPVGTATYSVLTLSDASGCPASVNSPAVTVNVDMPLTAGTGGLIVRYCSTDNNTYDLSSHLTGADPDGIWTDPNGNILPLPTAGTTTLTFDPQTMPQGIYTYTVNNPPSACIPESSTVEVLFISPPNAGITPIPQSFCANEPAIDLSTLLGVPSPDGTWTDPNAITSTPPLGTASFTFNPSINSAGIYTYTVIDPTGTCPPGNSTVDISIDPIPTAIINTSNNDICIGDLTDLTFTLTGAANYNVEYNDGTTTTPVILDASGNDITTGSPVSVQPNTTTTYTITTITDDNSCVNTSSSNVTINVTLPGNAGVTGAPVLICETDVFLHDLSTFLGGSQDNDGVWTDPSGNPLPNPPLGTSTFMFDPQIMAAGDYTYTVSAPPCPPVSEKVIVNIITAPDAGTAIPGQICINDYSSTNPFDLNTLLSGADAGGQWSDISGSIMSTIDPSTYGSGNFSFTYTVVDATGTCNTDQTIVNLIINPTPSVNSFTATQSLISQGATTDLIIDMLQGVPPFTVYITDDDTPPNVDSIIINSGMIGSITVSPNVISPTNYYITSIVDGNGCIGTSASTIAITVVPYPIIDPFTAPAEICKGDPISASITLIQGAPPVTIYYSIYNNGNLLGSYNEVIGILGQSCPIVSSFALDTAVLNLNIGQNNIIVTDSVVDNNGKLCPINFLPPQFSVMVNPIPDVNLITTTDIICFNEDAILEFHFLDGTPIFNVDYTINTVAQIPLLFTGLGNQPYTVTPPLSVGDHTFEIVMVTDEKGCSTNMYPANPVTVTVNALPILSIAVVGTTPICINESSELMFPVTIGAPPFNVLYETNGVQATASVDGTGYDNSTGLPFPISPTVTTKYQLVKITDNNGCESFIDDSTELVVHPLADVTISPTTGLEICDKEVAYIKFNFTDGTGPWIVDYMENSVIQTPLQFTNIVDSFPVSPNAQTIYTFTNIDDFHNCDQGILFVVPLAWNPLPVCTIYGGGSVCDDGSEVDITIDITGGTPDFDIEYSRGTTVELETGNAGQYTFYTNQQGAYSIAKITDSKGCMADVSSSGFVNVNINPMPIAMFSAFPQPADITNPLINFVDQSIGHKTGIWHFGDGQTMQIDSSLINIEIKHLYPQEDTSYIVTLEVYTDSGCTAIIIDTIVIDPIFTIFVPDAFTPNNDLYNDYFLPMVDNVLEYEFSVYNRFGERIFTTNSYTNTDQRIYNGGPEAWDGKYKGTDIYAMPGQYAYSIQLIDLHGKERVIQGTFTLIR